LFTFDKVIERIKKTLGFKMDDRVAKRFFEYWYNYALRDYIASSQAGKYRPLKRVLEATLTRSLLCYFDNDEYNTTEVDMEALLASFDAIELDPRALEALQMLKAEGKWDIWVLATGGYQDTVQLLNRADLEKFIGDNILCCDDLRISRPHPKVYSEMMRLAVHKTKRIEVVYDPKNIILLRN
jgi:FMN phosphatase YigB (HAD superfamily)